MDIMASLVLFSVFIVVYTIFIEIFTVLFRLTGVTREKARTQVISLLTNSGFTTSESEIIMSAKKRRRLAHVTMIFGYSFSMIIVSMLVNIFLSLNLSELKNISLSVLILFIAMLLLMLIGRLKPVRSGFDLIIEKIGNRVMFGKKSNILVLVDIYKNNALVETVTDHIPAFLHNVRLADSRLKEQYGIRVLSIKRGTETLEAIDGNTTLAHGDNLLLFGDYKTIRQIFEKPIEN